MSHLIQTLFLGCIKHGATTPKWRTGAQASVQIFDEFDPATIAPTGTEDGDEWLLTSDSTGTGIGLIEYDTCCIWKATLRYTTSASDHQYIGVVEINNVEIDRFDLNFGSTGEEIDLVIDLNDLGLMNRACGSNWKIYVVVLPAVPAPPVPTSTQMTLSIIDVTFGPPV